MAAYNKQSALNIGLFPITSNSMLNNNNAVNIIYTQIIHSVSCACQSLLKLNAQITHHA